MQAPTDAAGPSPLTPLSGGRSTYAIGLLLVIYVMNFLDRQVITILAEPIKTELDLADWQIGAMSGIAFAFLYTVLGLPVARLAERTHRPRLIAAACAFWSVFTMLCGLAQNFTQLILARIGVGVGEAGCSPTSMSLISDYVPREKRGLAISIYMTGPPIGALVGLALGGVIADAWGWRAAFLVLGAPGLLAALVAALTLTEPRRQAAVLAAGPSPKVESFGAVLRRLATSRTYLLMVGGMTLQAILQYGLGAFLGSFYLRVHGPELAQLGAHFGLQPTGVLGIALGLVIGGAGILGALFGGAVADRWALRDPRAYVLTSAFAVVGAVPLTAAGLLAPQLAAALIFMLAAFFGYAVSAGPCYAVVQGLVSPSMRATAVAIMLFMVNLVGMGVGPLFIGLVSDAFNASGMGGAEGLRAALLSFTVIGIPLAACFWTARKSVVADTCS